MRKSLKELIYLIKEKHKRKKKIIKERKWK